MLNKKVLIWDLDNTLYRITSEIGHNLDKTMAKVAVEDLGIPLSFEEALNAVKESFAKYRDGGEIFYNEHGVDIKEFYEKYHANVPHNNIVPFEGLGDELRSLDAQQYIFTYSTIELATRIVKQIGLWDVFQGRIYSVENFNTYKKNEDEKVYVDLCKKIGHAPEDCMFIDDSYSNLEFAGKAGMTTVRIYYKNEDSKHMGNADYAFVDALEFVKEYKKNN